MVFRQAIMIILQNKNKKVLVTHKTNAPDNDWYFPSGGIEQGETPLDTFWRELEEELGLNSTTVEPPKEAPFTHRYEWSESLLHKTGFQGQEQIIMVAMLKKPVLLKFKKHGELDAARWIPFKDLNNAIPHKDLIETVNKLPGTGL